MPSKYQQLTLSEICTEISYGYTESAHIEKIGPKFLRITDIQGGVVDWYNVPYCPIEKEKLEKYLLEYGDIVVARTGNSTGENYAYKGSEKSVFASYLIRFRVDKSKANPFFVWYQMRTQRWFDFVSASKSGSAQAGANAKVLGNFVVSLPSINIQNSVVQQLENLDDKIALNREMNKTLEAMAQAIFKSWFVDFEPFKEGEFVESELGMIPKGWEVKSIGDIIELAYGKALGKEIRQDGNIPVYGSGGITGFHNEALVKAPGIIVGRKGTVGSVYWASNDFYPIDTVFYVKPKQELSLYWIYEVLRTMDIKQFSADSAVPGVNRNVIQAQIVVVSNIETMQKFDNHIKSYIDLIDQNQKQIETLSTLRDTLLPKLLSGEIEV